jgi:hypothetical protein
VVNTTGRPIPNLYDREPDDWYAEPPWAVESLLDAMGMLAPPGPVWDPACGSGTIPDVLSQRKIRHFASDIRAAHPVVRGDFLKFSKPPMGVRSILCNPPYRDIEAWIRHAHRIMPPGAPVVFLARLSLLEGQARYRNLWQACPPVRVWVHCKRVSIPPAGQDIPARGGSVAYAWFEWRVKHYGEQLVPAVRWIP